MQQQQRDPAMAVAFMKPRLVVVLAAVVMLTASCAIFNREDVYTDKPVHPELFVEHEPIPDLPRMYLKLHVWENRQPQAFSLTMVLYRYVHRMWVPYGSWGRGLSDLPGPQESIWWAFPDSLPPHNEGPLNCVNGSFYSRWRVKGVSHTGQAYDETFVYPYNLAKKPAYKHPPSAHRSWRVNCSRPGRVRDPLGEGVLSVRLW